VGWPLWSALVGFALFVVVSFVLVFGIPDNRALSVAASSTFWFVTHLFWVIAMLLGLLCLIGIYARQAERVGVLGLIAFLLTFFGWALYSAWTWSETFIYPVFAHVAPQFMDHPDQKLLMTLNASQTTHWLLLGAGLTLFGVGSLRAGARGYLLKGADKEESLRAIRAVASGEAIFGPAIAQRLMRYLALPRPAMAPIAFPELTEREREILSRIAQGWSNQEIATSLVVSLKTVRNHVSNIFSKLQVADRTQAILQARKAGLGNDIPDV
jgi:DNA-binding CsgD family transcriptional regulator